LARLHCESEPLGGDVIWEEGSKKQHYLPLDVNKINDNAFGEKSCFFIHFWGKKFAPWTKL